MTKSCNRLKLKDNVVNKYIGLLVSHEKQQCNDEIRPRFATMMEAGESNTKWKKTDRKQRKKIAYDVPPRQNKRNKETNIQYIETLKIQTQTRNPKEKNKGPGMN